MNKTTGLTKQEVARSRAAHGENRLTRQKSRSFLREFFSAFADPLIIILLVSLALNLLFSFAGGDYYEAMGIGAAVLISVFVSTLSEYKSEKAFEKLREDTETLVCRVRRDGHVTSVSAHEIVVGDVVLLSAGDTVPADGRLLCGRLSIDQSALNGESREAEKRPGGKDSSLHETSAVFCGTTVLSDEGEMEVTRVGDETLYGKLALELGAHQRRSPLKEKLSRLAKTLAKIGYCSAALIAAADFLTEVYQIGAGNLLQGFSLAASNPALLLPPLLHALTLAVTVVVVSVPEGLPMMITVVLSSQMRRMMREGVLLKKLSGIETAGGMDLLFCDKTGTLTEGRHCLQNTLSFDGRTLRETTLSKQTRHLHFRLNNEAHQTARGIIGSNATDRALLAAAPNLSLSLSVVARESFDSTKKYSSCTLSDGSVLLKGAPEAVLKKCAFVRLGARNVPKSNALSQAILAAAKEEEARGSRLVAFAEGRTDTSLVLTFFGALSDRLRKESAETVENLQTAGVQVVMLTGDSETAAKTHAKNAGILKEGGAVLSSEELSRLSDDEVRALLPRLCVIYRCTPSDKSRLATLCASAGRVCGMTGDGINDAPALKRADVGFAMGSGTQLARDAADVVLTDDRLSSLARAVLYGRTVFRSIQKFLIFQLTMNFCALSVSLLSPLFGIETPIGVLQMLWVNLIMDTLASLAFSGEAPRQSYMNAPPRKRTEAILQKREYKAVLFGTLFSLITSLLFLSSSALRGYYGFETDPLPFLTAFFVLFVFLGVFNMFNVRTPRVKLWAELAKNPGFVLVVFLISAVQITLCTFGSRIFGCAPLSAPLLAFPILVALVIVPADLLRKSVTKKS